MQPSQNDNSIHHPVPIKHGIGGINVSVAAVTCWCLGLKPCAWGSGDITTPRGIEPLAAQQYLRDIGT